MDHRMTKIAETWTKRSFRLLLTILIGSACNALPNVLNGYQARDCLSSSGTHHHGQSFSRDMLGVCLRFRCDNGNEIMIEKQCRDETGRCYQVGGTRQHSQCVQQTCTLTDGYISLKATTRECAFKGQCVKVNQEVTDGCLAYRCSEAVLGDGKYKLGMELVQTGCHSPEQNGCLPLGQTIRCGSLVCDRREQAVGFFPVKHACEDPETGTCHELGATWKTRSCVTLLCEADESMSGAYATRIAVVSRGCPDDNGKCHEPDGVSTFLVTVKGQLRQCTCQQHSDNSVQYSCLSDGVA